MRLNALHFNQSKFDIRTMREACEMLTSNQETPL